ncbi:MAG: septal ring lytic transglycosylase RlpA family protein [Alphaproteobacteria bacterium]|nr:septal ring lytic transglycosylase RlpA family protein [Alphaproteobacteria bacterium]
MTRKYKKIFVSTLAISLVSTIGYAAQFKPITKVAGVADAPEATPYVKVGNAYEVNGVKYEPKVVDDYDVIGIASWYGEQFHGKKTANGELFDMEELTAAHPTLPLPSFVEVTNVENGKKVILRVNDRGPFSKYRNIDISKKGAEILGFENQGTTNVRIRLLANISKEAAVELNKINMQKNAEKDKAMNTNAVVPQKADQPAPAVVPTQAPVAAPADVDAAVATDDAPSNEAGISSASAAADGDLGLVDKEEILKSSDSKSMKTISLIEPNDVKSYTPRGVFVQIGAYSDSNENIKKQMGSLSSVGVVSLQKVDVNGKDILRLRVGPYGSIDDAIKIKNNLVRLGYTNSRVIVEQ